MTIEGADRQTSIARPQRHIDLIVNTHARHGRARFEAVRTALKQCGLAIDRECASDRMEEVGGFAADCVRRGVEILAVGGGDGTIRQVASVLAGTDVALAVIPLGTVNDLARNLRLDPNPEIACRVFANGTFCRIDLAKANEDVFAITASVGFSALMQQALTPRLKQLFGPLAYFVASMHTRRKVRSLEITISGDHPRRSLITTQAGVVNGHSWMGGRFHVPGIDLESGRLAFYAVPPTTSMGYFRMVRHVRHGDFFRTPGMVAFTTSDLTLTTRVPSPLVLDGDLVGRTPVRFTVMRDALKVVVPPDYLTAETDNPR